MTPHHTRYREHGHVAGRHCVRTQMDMRDSEGLRKAGGGQVVLFLQVAKNISLEKSGISS